MNTTNLLLIATAFLAFISLSFHFVTFIQQRYILDLREQQHIEILSSFNDMLEQIKLRGNKYNHEKFEALKKQMLEKEFINFAIKIDLELETFTIVKVQEEIFRLMIEELEKH
jgi:hypothetical protein